MEPILIHNVKTVFEGNILHDSEILLQGGKIQGIGAPGFFRAGQFLNGNGFLILPGLIDPHVHFRDSGIPNVSQDRKEDFSTGTKAALAGGFTTVLDMPNTVPPTATLTDYKTKRDNAAKKAYCDFGLYALAGRDNLAQIPEMLPAGAVAVKLYMGQTTGSNLLADESLEEKFFEASAAKDFLLAVHAEDQECLDEHELLHQKDRIPRHNQVRPPECAVLAVKRALEFQEKYRNRTYFCHVSTRAEIERIRAQKLRGFKAYVEVTPHHLFFDESEQDRQSNRVKINPPLRGNQDVSALWQALNDGTADTIGTDHSPHPLEEKRRDYWDCPSGFPELETALPLLVTAALEERTTLQTIQRLCCSNPARIFRLSGKGKLETGYDADLVFVDLKNEKPVDESTLFTRSGWSPYAGKRLKGWPVVVYLRGKKVFDRGHVFGPFGNEVKINET